MKIINTTILTAICISGLLLSGSRAARRPAGQRQQRGGIAGSTRRRHRPVARTWDPAADRTPDRPRQ